MKILPLRATPLLSIGAPSVDGVYRSDAPSPYISFQDMHKVNNKERFE